MSWLNTAFAPMDELSQLATLPPSGDADPVPQTLLAAFPEQAKTLGLLYDVSRELTAILDREELLRRIAERIKKLVPYDVFTVMLWNEKTQPSAPIAPGAVRANFPRCHDRNADKSIDTVQDKPKPR